MKHALIAGFVVLTQSLNAQVLRTVQDARHRAEQFLQAIGARHSITGCTVTSRQERFGTPRTFLVEGANGSFGVVIWDETGQVVGYSDFAAAMDLLNRTGSAPRVIRTQEAAWGRARSFLQACGYASNNFVPQQLSAAADLPGADQDRNNKADRYSLRLVQKGYPVHGLTNDASVTFDVVTGKPLLANISPYLPYEPPVLRVIRWSALAVLLGIVAVVAKRWLGRARVH